MPAPQRVARPGRKVRDHGLMIDGHDPDAVETAVLAYLADRDLSGAEKRRWRIYLRNHDSAIVEAWHDGTQFVQEHHAGAQPVTVVNLPEHLTAD